jgi:RimJ/RimL family protein N-acetyltransferase
MTNQSRAAPAIETARLRLRGFRESDLDAQAAVLGDPEVTRHLGGSTFSREDTWRRMLASPGLWTMLGYGYWAVERLDDGAYLGQAGFADFKRDMQPSIEGRPEMGWIFAPHAQGQGYAAEAVAAALDWADTALQAPEITAIIDPDNARSIRLAEKAGFDVREDATYRGEPILLFRRVRNSSPRNRGQE